MRIFLHTDLTDHTDLVRGDALTVFEHESHEFNEYFIAHGSHGSHGSFSLRLIATMESLDFECGTKMDIREPCEALADP